MEEPLGSLAGRGFNRGKKGGKIVIKCNEPCYIIGIASITPNLGTGSVVKTSGGGFLRFGTSVENEDASHTHSKISGYTVVVGTGSDPDTIYLSTS